MLFVPHFLLRFLSGEILVSALRVCTTEKNNIACVFPFKDKEDVEYHNCDTVSKHGMAWCATAPLQPNGRYTTNKWGKCAEHCKCLIDVPITMTLTNKQMKLDDSECELLSGTQNVILNIGGENLYVNTGLMTNIPEHMDLCESKSLKGTYENDGEEPKTTNVTLEYKPDWAKLEKDLGPVIDSSMCMSQNNTLAINISLETLSQKAHSSYF